MDEMNEEKFWIVFVEGTSGDSHKKHSSYVDARDEAGRLAVLNRDKKVYCCQAMSYCWVPEFPIQWRLLA